MNSFLFIFIFRVYLEKYVFFSGDPVVPEGFGSVFDGQINVGELCNLSTQAVLELVQKISENGEAGFVQVDRQDLEDFNIPRNDSGVFFVYCKNAMKLHS